MAGFAAAGGRPGRVNGGLYDGLETVQAALGVATTPVDNSLASSLR